MPLNDVMREDFPFCRWMLMETGYWPWYVSEKQGFWRNFFHITGKPVRMCRITFTLCLHWRRFILINKTFFLPVLARGFAAGSTGFPQWAFAGLQWGKGSKEQGNAVWVVGRKFCAVPLQQELANSLMKQLIHERYHEIRLLCKFMMFRKEHKSWKHFPYYSRLHWILAPGLFLPSGCWY